MYQIEISETDGQIKYFNNKRNFRINYTSKLYFSLFKLCLQWRYNADQSDEQFVPESAPAGMLGKSSTKKLFKYIILNFSNFTRKKNKIPPNATATVTAPIRIQIWTTVKTTNTGNILAIPKSVMHLFIF